MKPPAEGEAGIRELEQQFDDLLPGSYAVGARLGARSGTATVDAAEGDVLRRADLMLWPSAWLKDGVDARHGLDDVALVELFQWSENEFLERTAGSAIRRTGYAGWLRNIAVALGNVDLEQAADPAALMHALERRRAHSSELVREHVEWALSRLGGHPDGF